ncbi:inositol 5-phosphatase-like protein [Acephala macrosclerotiorum]|nr:inositol 5-phosphatase-like protein [Acephala macrosclerotiorum]
MAALNLYLVTFNCGLTYINIDAFSSKLFTGLTSPSLPDLIILSLQEIAPIPHSLIGGSFLVPYFSRFYHAVQKGARKWSNATDDLPIYDPVAARNLGMTGLMIFAKDPSRIKDIEFDGVGVGLAEMGNKGAVGLRFKYHGSAGTFTELTFVAAHLAAMEWEVKRRNEDWENIVRGLVFSSTSGKATTSLSAEEKRPLLSISGRDAGIYKPTSHLFVAGDLNYRTSSISPAPNDHVDTFPQPHHDSSSPNHYSALFEHDQLTQELAAKRTLQGLKEAPVTFPPTYKYTSKEPFLTPDEELTEWNWAKHRWPSWCDRILYLPIPAWLSRSSPSAEIVVKKYTALPLFPTSDHRAVAAEISVPLIEIPAPTEEELEEKAGDDPRLHPPFEVDIDWKSKRDRARILELIVGFTLYFTTTAEGGGVILAMAVGAVGAYFAIRAMLEM